MAKNSSSFTWSSYLARLAGALTLVFVTYNPSGHSFFHWFKPVFRDPQMFRVEMALAAIVLLIAWVIFLRFTSESLGLGSLPVVCSLGFSEHFTSGRIVHGYWSVIAWLGAGRLVGLS
jgi:hypothetical protein